MDGRPTPGVVIDIRNAQNAIEYEVRVRMAGVIVKPRQRQPHDFDADARVNVTVPENAPQQERRFVCTQDDSQALDRQHDCPTTRVFVHVGQAQEGTYYEL